MYQNQLRQRNQPNSDDIATLSSIAGWWGALLTAVLLMVAVQNLGINTRTLEATTENAENTRRNAKNTAEIVEQLKKINSKLERMT